jgi:hypothetical protein
VTVLSASQHDAFRRDGFLVYGPLLGADEAVAIGTRLDALAADGDDALLLRRVEGGAASVEGPVEAGDVAQLIGPVEADDVVRALAADERILTIVAALLGTDDVHLFGNQALMKPAHHGGHVSWHQDAGYWGSLIHDLDPPVAVTCWVAIDAVTEENGCVRMLPGSHRAGPLPHSFDEDDLMRHVEGVDVAGAVPVVLPRGGASFHHSCTVHGSGRNETPFRRRGLALHYCRPPPAPHPTNELPGNS